MSPSVEHSSRESINNEFEFDERMNGMKIILLHGKAFTFANLYQSFSEYCKVYDEPLNLCGLSLGGVLALQFAIENPDRVKSMVLIGTQYVMPKRLLKLQNIVFHILPNSSFQSMGIGKKEAISLSKSMMDLNFHQDLKKIKSPVLLVCGEKDKANMRASLQLKAQISDASFEIIKNAGHEVNMDAPEDLGDVLNRFYRRILI